MRLSIHPEALDDLMAGRNFYRDQVGTKLAQDFIGEFERLSTLLIKYPGFGTPEAGVIRKQPMKRFPYNIMYRLGGDVLRILAVAHHSRKPQYWRARR